MGFTKFVVIALLATTLMASVESRGDCPFNYSSYEGSQKKFNIIFKNNSAAAKSHFELLSSCLNKNVKHVSDVDYSKDFEENDVHNFSVEGALYGYTALLNPEFVKEHLVNNEDIKTVGEDTEMKIQHPLHRRSLSTTDRDNPNPNLDRIDQEKFPLDGKYVFPATAGKGVTMYIVDTGIFIKHNEFEGRAKHGISTCSDCPDSDDHGHGTHVAAITGGKTFGVANQIDLIAVKVLNATGFGQTSEIIAGLSFILQDHQSKSGQNSVVNMSLGGSKDKVLNDAVEALTDNGIHVAIAAGNDAADACNASPASEKPAITVGATEDTSDEITDFSNFGGCVDIFAPGRNITSAGITDKDATNVYSGTSQATPHVAGTVALIIGEFGNSSTDKMVATLIDFATKGVISDKGLNRSPNVFLRVPYEK